MLNFMPDGNLLRQHPVPFFSFDCPGYGDSAPQPNYNTLLELAKRVHLLLDNLCKLIRFSGAATHAVALTSLIMGRVKNIDCLAELAPIQKTPTPCFLLQLTRVDRDETIAQLNPIASTKKFQNE